MLKGNLSVGGEYSYNHRTDAYTFLASDYVPVKAFPRQHGPAHQPRSSHQQ